jgi:cell division septation protein DedD
MKAALLALILASTGVAFAAADGAPDVAALQAKAQTGDAEAEFQLAEAYRGGRGVTADPETAIMWYRRAAAHGHVRASEELGFALFAHGDRREAMPYIERAAARGEPRAFYLLGTAHFNGDYATRDWPLAYAQTMRAAAAGLPAAQRNLDLMDHYLLPSDKAKAEQILATLPTVRTAAATDGAGGAQRDGAPAPRPKPIAPAAAQATIAAAPAKPPKASKSSGRAVSADEPVGGPWKVQLGAFGTADRARDRWKQLTAKVTVLARYDQHIAAAGTVQRLQAGGISSRAAAQALCAKVRSAGSDCLVIAP